MMERVLGKDLKCMQHDFRLYPLSDPYNAQYYNVSFCTCKHEKVGRRQSKSVRKTPNVTFPTFNHDNNFSTPTFILHSERNYYESEGPKMKVEHQKKMQDYTESKLEINIPKPRSKNNYCSVCKANYDDYLDHINAEPHKRKISQSSFNKDILQLTNKYQRETVKKARACRRGMMEKTASVTRIEDDDSDSVQIISNPHKLIKPNQNINHTNKIIQPIPQKHVPKLIQNPNPNPNTNPTLNQANRPQSTNAVTNNNGFKPFSSTYQQMNQFILNLNIIFNPYPNTHPPSNLLTPYNLTLQARQQLNLLQNSLMNQLSFCNRLQQASQVGSPPPVTKPTCIVIDD